MGQNDTLYQNRIKGWKIGCKYTNLQMEMGFLESRARSYLNLDIFQNNQYFLCNTATRGFMRIFTLVNNYKTPLICDWF